MHKTLVIVVIGHIGGSFVFDNSVTSVTQQLCTVVIQGISNAAPIMTGHTLGEGDRKWARLQGNTFAK